MKHTYIVAYKSRPGSRASAMWYWLPAGYWRVQHSSFRTIFLSVRVGERSTRERELRPVGSLIHAKRINTNRRLPRSMALNQPTLAACLLISHFWELFLEMASISDKKPIMLLIAGISGRSAHLSPVTITPGDPCCTVIKNQILVKTSAISTPPLTHVHGSF